MRILLLTMLLAMSSMVCFGQKPMYYWSRSDSDYTVRPFGTGGNGKVQYNYHSSDFPTAPTGNMSAIYLHVARPAQFAGPSILYYLTIKMGYTVDSNFPYSPAKPDTFKTGLTTVYAKDETILYGTDSSGKWIKIPLNPNSFTYYAMGDTSHSEGGAKPKKYFIVEFSSKLTSSPNPMNAYITCARNSGGLGGMTTQTYSTSVTGNLYDFGFDIGPPISTGIVQPAFTRSVSVFPNPSTDGSFNISFETSENAGEVSVTATNVAGQRVLNRQYLNVGKSFFQQFSLGEQAKGIYMVCVEAGGSIINRRLIVR